MPSTYSNLKIQLMATGENNTTWGDVTNLNLGTALEEAIVGSADVTFASGNVTLTLTDTNASQTARNMRLRCTGTTGGSTRNLIVPSIEKPYIVRNDCADSVVVKTAAGTGITVPAGKTMWVYSDATNVVDAVTHLSSLTLGSALPVSSGGSGTSTAFTTGSVLFAGASGTYSQDNANFFWDDTNNYLGIGSSSPAARVHVTASSGANQLRIQSNDTDATLKVGFASVGHYTNAQAPLSLIGGFADAASNNVVVGGGSGSLNAATTITFNTAANSTTLTGTERMRIDSAGRIGFNSASLGGGSGQFRFAGSVTGAATSQGILYTPTVNSDVTTTAIIVVSQPSTQAAAFTLTNLYNYIATPGTVGAGSTITNNMGFVVNSTLTGATNNYAFYGQLAAATGRWNLYMQGTADNYVAGRFGFGSTILGGASGTYRFAGSITGGINARGILASSTVASDVTATTAIFDSSVATEASAFTLASLSHYAVSQTSIGAGSTVTNQAGFNVSTLMTSATNNYAFYGQLAAATGRWNLYMQGTADNYIAGRVGFGSTSLGGASGTYRFSGTITGSTSSQGILYTPTVNSDVTTSAIIVNASGSTQAAAFTLTNFIHYNAQGVSLGAGSAVTNQNGYNVTSSFTNATNNYGFSGNIPSGTGRWNLYMGGTAANYLAGNLGIGTTTPAQPLDITVSLAGALVAQIKNTSNNAVATARLLLFNDIDTSAGFQLASSTAATDPNSAAIYNSAAAPIRFLISGAERVRIDSTGNLVMTGSGGIGYGTGSGGTVTQATSRTTGVTLNKTNGSITLVSAAGTTAWQSFTVTNSTVAATDTVIVNQRSGTDLNQIFVTAVGTGSFRISFATTGGTTTEQPVFTFAVIKAVTA